MGKRFCRIQGVVVSCALTIVMVTACSKARTTTTTPPRPAGSAAVEPIPLKVGVLPFLSSAVLTIANEEGYFAEQGLAVEMVSLKSDNDAFPLLLTDKLDVAPPAFTTGLFNAIASGGKIKVVFPLSTYVVQDSPSFGILARRSDIEAGRFATPAAWRGARITIPPAGPQAMGGFILEQALQQGGLTLKDVTIVPVDLPAQAEALKSGQTDLVYTVEPWITRALEMPELQILMPLEPVALGGNSIPAGTADPHASGTGRT